MLQLLRLMMDLTPAPDLYLAEVLMSCTLVWFRESPASTSQCCFNLTGNMLELYFLDSCIVYVLVSESVFKYIYVIYVLIFV